MSIAGNNMNLKINEFFTSIQKKGLYTGQVHFFLRLSGCNIKCDYCDTDTTKYNDLSIDNILKIIDDEYLKIPFRTISITGGEPLLQSQSLFEMLKRLDNKYRILLETNSTLPQELHKIIKYTDIVSMDYKPDFHNKNTSIFKDFYNICSQKDTYIKIVFNSRKILQTITALDIIREIIDQSTPVFLQPVTPVNDIDIKKGLELVYSEKKMDLRLFPQIHPFLNIK
jgi:organic radical activating enzyme